MHVVDGQELYNYCVYSIDLDNYHPSNCQQIEQALHALSLNFSMFDIGKICALCVNPGYTFNNCPEVTNPILNKFFILDDSQRLTHDPPHATATVIDIAHFLIPFQFVNCQNDESSTGPADDTSPILWFCFNDPVYCLLDQDQ